MYTPSTVVGGRYRLVRKIGEGGMASVWQAEHMTLGSPVAVKFLHAGKGPNAKGLVERFMREARVAAAVRHRNVIEIKDFGITDEGDPFMVMELLEGESLADRMDRELPLPVFDSCRIMSLVLRGLAAVHDAGIVHRDLKPENIFLVADADGIFPKLLDFGVSRRVGAANTHLTQEGVLVGTPDYMSPEQARGLRDIDLRTDIYSAGVMLFELVTGRLPFESENVGDLIVMITTEPPPSVSELRPDIPADVAEVIEQAMEKDREQRFQDARQMRWALMECFSEAGGFGDRPTGVSSISEMPPSIRALRRSKVSRRKAAVTAAATPEVLGAPGTGSLPKPVIPKRRRGNGLVVAGLVLALGVGVGLALHQARKPPRHVAARAIDRPTPWTPSTPFAPGILDAGADAGRSVSVRLYDVPEGGTVRIDGVTVPGAQAELPAGPYRYHMEVVAPDAGTPMWLGEHPGAVSGEYDVWPMSDDELAAAAQAEAPDGGVPDAAAAPEAGAAVAPAPTPSPVVHTSPAPPAVGVGGHPPAGP